MELDPYKVLEVPYDANLSVIRSHFKKLVLKHHPDRGGNPTIFNIIKNAYSYLYKYKIAEQEQLKNEQRNFDKYTSQRNFQTEELDRKFENLKINVNDKNLDINKFNTLFEQHKLEDADSRGYNFKRGGSREDAEELIKKYSNKKNKKMEIQVYHDPEPIELTTDNYKRLGQKYVDDFSQNTNNKNTHYSDLQKAYTEYDTTNMKNIRTKNYKSLDEYQNVRKNQDFNISPEEKARLHMKKQQELAMEEKRRYYHNEENKKIEKQFNSLSRYLTFN